jgi:hypothetical protein
MAFVAMVMLRLCCGVGARCCQCVRCPQLNEVQQKMSRFHGLTATNPERKDIAKQVDTECNSIVWQVRRILCALCRAVALWASTCNLRVLLATCSQLRGGILSYSRHAQRGAGIVWLQHKWERHALAAVLVHTACLQLNELNSAVDVAAENPARFNLTSEELASRRRWIEGTQRQARLAEGNVAAVNAHASAHGWTRATSRLQPLC